MDDIADAGSVVSLWLRQLYRPRHGIYSRLTKFAVYDTYVEKSDCTGEAKNRLAVCDPE